MPMPWKIRAVQLDLARQMEPVDFICRYADFIASHGFNTLVLYLEGRIRTTSFPYRAPEASYSLEDMDRVVRHARKAGVDVVPVVSVLGHSEQFFACPEMAALAEERDGGSRFGGHGKSTFCPSLPGTYEFLATYLREVVSVFPAPHLHLGLDESWNLGYCRPCAERWKAEGLGPLFSQHVHQAWEICNHLGKRMWMWDDFYEFFPEELGRTPRDIVMCHWNYDDVIHLEGAAAHFRNRWRQDWLAEYERRGIDVIVSPCVGLKNVFSFTDYARHHSVLGGLATQWEMSSTFHTGYAPSIAVIGKLWNTPAYDPAAALDAGVQAALPDANEDTRNAVKSIIQIPHGPLRTQPQANLLGPLTRGEQAERDALQLALQLLREVRKGAATPKSTGILDELENTTRQGLAGWMLRELTPAVYDPRRPAADTPRLLAMARHCRAEIEALIPVRERQHAELRPGCQPANHAAEGLRKAVAFVDDLIARLERPPQPDEAWLVLRLCLPDVHGSPRLRVSVLFGNEPREILMGGFKPPTQSEGSHYTIQVPFTSAKLPDAVRLELWGHGGQGVCYVEAQNRTQRRLPTRIRSALGPVRDPEAVLRDDSLFTWLGHSDILSAIHHPERAEERAILQIELGP